MSWDSRWAGVFSVLDPIAAGNANVPASIQADIHNIDKWQVQYWSHVPHDSSSDTNFIATTPAGFSYLTSWGSARYNTAAQLEALAYRKNSPTDPDSVFQQLGHGPDELPDGRQPGQLVLHRRLRLERAVRRVRGRRQREAASHPHHGDAQGSLTNSQSDPATNKHILWGALVGGPARPTSRTT